MNRSAINGFALNGSGVAAQQQQVSIQFAYARGVMQAALSAFGFFGFYSSGASSAKRRAYVAADPRAVVVVSEVRQMLPIEERAMRVEKSSRTMIVEPKAVVS